VLADNPRDHLAKLIEAEFVVIALVAIEPVVMRRLREHDEAAPELPRHDSGALRQRDGVTFPGPAEEASVVQCAIGVSARSELQYLFVSARRRVIRP
jgi:hypothetical protein